MLVMSITGLHIKESMESPTQMVSFHFDWKYKNDEPGVHTCRKKGSSKNNSDCKGPEAGAWLGVF